MFCDCAALKVLVAFDIYGVCTYARSSRTKGRSNTLYRYSKLSPAVSWLVRCDLHTHLPIFCDSSALKVLVAVGIYARSSRTKRRSNALYWYSELPARSRAWLDKISGPICQYFATLSVCCIWCLTVCTYTRSSRTKRRCNTLYRYSKLPAVSWLVKRDLRTYLPMFRETWTADFSNWSTASRNGVHGRVFGLYRYGWHFREKQWPSERKWAAAALCKTAKL